MEHARGTCGSTDLVVYNEVWYYDDTCNEFKFLTQKCGWGADCPVSSNIIKWRRTNYSVGWGYICEGLSASVTPGWFSYGNVPVTKAGGYNYEWEGGLDFLSSTVKLACPIVTSL